MTETLSAHPSPQTLTPKFYECGICEHLHAWDWNGDCRQDSARLTFETVPDNAEIFSMHERIVADLNRAAADQ